LKDRCYEQADELERKEGEMATQAKALGLLQVDNDKLQIEVSRLRVEKEALEKLVASGDATIEELEKDKKTLIHDMAGTSRRGSKRLWPRPSVRTRELTFPTAIPLITSSTGRSCPWSWMTEPPPSTATLLLCALYLFFSSFDELVTSLNYRSFRHNYG